MRCNCYRRNSDSDYRNLERFSSSVDFVDFGDKIKLVQYGLRAGRIPIINVGLAAELGHPVALAITPAREGGLGLRSVFSDMLAQDKSNQTLIVRVILTYIKRILPRNLPEGVLGRLRGGLMVLRMWDAAEDLLRLTDTWVHASQSEWFDVDFDRIADATQNLFPLTDGVGFLTTLRPARFTKVAEDRHVNTIYHTAKAILEMAFGVVRLANPEPYDNYLIVSPAEHFSFAANHAARASIEEERWQTDYLAEVLLGLQTPA